MSSIIRDGTFIEYRVRGKGDITLLFVHGSYLDQECWESQVEHFEADYRVATLDLPGHGLSGKGRKHWSVGGFAVDVSAVMRKLDSDSIILIGHSMGADINLIAAVNHPESVMGFIAVENFKNAATPLPPENQGQVKSILDDLQTDFSGTNEKYARMGLLTPETPAPIVDYIVSTYRNAYRPMGLPIAPEIFEMWRTEKELLPLLDHKLNLINVDYFPTNEEPLQHYARNGYALIRMEGTCHFPMLENPRALNAALDQAIANIRKEASVAV
ncbi:MAG: alpha/beta hydrolase [Fibrobacteria bacterium]